MMNNIQRAAAVLALVSATFAAPSPTSEGINLFQRASPYKYTTFLGENIAAKVKRHEACPDMPMKKRHDGGPCPPKTNTKRDEYPEGHQHKRDEYPEGHQHKRDEYPEGHQHKRDEYPEGHGKDSKDHHDSMPGMDHHDMAGGAKMEGKGHARRHEACPDMPMRKRHDGGPCPPKSNTKRDEGPEGHQHKRDEPKDAASKDAKAHDNMPGMDHHDMTGGAKMEGKGHARRHEACPDMPMRKRHDGGPCPAKSNFKA